jgi:hypothetical protein
MDPRSFTDKQFMLEELKLDYLYKFGEISRNGVNLGALDYFLRMTPHQRLVFIERHRDALAYHQDVELSKDDPARVA